MTPNWYMCVVPIPFCPADNKYPASIKARGLGKPKYCARKRYFLTPPEKCGFHPGSRCGAFTFFALDAPLTPDPSTWQHM